MLAVHGFYENGQVRFNHIPPIKNGVMRVIVTFLEEENDEKLNTYAHHLTNIDSFAALKPNWDTYNADAITPKSIVIAKELVTDLYKKNIPIEGVFPMRNGGVQIEFSKQTMEIELEILDEMMQYLVYENSILLENKSLYNQTKNDILKIL